MKLDKTDKKILFYLEQDARMSISKMAKLVEKSRELINYRIKKLEQNNTIKNYITRINQSYFYIGGASLTLKLRYIKKQRHLEIIEYFKFHKNINWFAELCGTQDFSITFLYKNAQDLAKIISEITIFLGKDLQSHNLSLQISEYKFDRKGILEFKEKKYSKNIETHFNQINTKEKLDNNDIIILKELAVNSKIKNIELAKKIKMSEDIVRIRIKKLEKASVIQGYTITINPHCLDLEGYVLYLQIEKMTESMQEKIKNFVNLNPNIYFCGRVAGKFNLIIGLYSKNRNHFKELLLNLKNFLGEYLKDYEFQLLMEEHKEVFVAENFLNQN